MSVLTREPSASTCCAGSEQADDSIQEQVAELLSRLYPRNALAERRRENRYPFPYLVHLTPVDDALAPAGESVVVVGKHLSPCGVGFYHPKPISHRRMIVSFEAGQQSWLSFLIDVTWCRFTKQGWYESGGRFLQRVDPPAEVAS